MGLALHGGRDLVSGVLAQEQHTAYIPVTQNPGTLEAWVAALEHKLADVVASGDAITVTGANLWVVNGTGTTDGEPNGLGNVVVGYNESDSETTQRTGSHMVVVGKEHDHRSFGGVVVGLGHATMGEYASVTGGLVNHSSGLGSTVTGGKMNMATAPFSYVAGGENNRAIFDGSSVGGGSRNTAKYCRSTFVEPV